MRREFAASDDTGMPPGGEFDSRQGKLIPTQPLLYNAFGQNAWVVPLVARTGKYQTVALVQAKNGHVVVGSSSSTSPEAGAFAQGGNFPAVGAPQASTPRARSIVGTLECRAVLGVNVHFTARGERRAFAYDAHDDAAALLARSGDSVRLSWQPAAGGYASVTRLVDIARPAAHP